MSKHDFAIDHQPEPASELSSVTHTARLDRTPPQNSIGGIGGSVQVNHKAMLVALHTASNTPNRVFEEVSSLTEHGSWKLRTPCMMMGGGGGGAGGGAGGVSAI